MQTIMESLNQQTPTVQEVHVANDQSSAPTVHVSVQNNEATPMELDHAQSDKVEKEQPQIVKPPHSTVNILN